MDYLIISKETAEFRSIETPDKYKSTNMKFHQIMRILEPIIFIKIDFNIKKTLFKSLKDEKYFTNVHFEFKDQKYLTNIHFEFKDQKLNNQIEKIKGCHIKKFLMWAYDELSKNPDNKLLQSITNLINNLSNDNLLILKYQEEDNEKKDIN